MEKCFIKILSKKTRFCRAPKDFRKGEREREKRMHKVYVINVVENCEIVARRWTHDRALSALWSRWSKNLKLDMSGQQNQSFPELKQKIRKLSEARIGDPRTKWGWSGAKNWQMLEEWSRILVVKNGSLS